MILFLGFIIFVQSVVILTLIRLHNQLEKQLINEIKYNEKLKKRLEKINGIKI